MSLTAVIDSKRNKVYKSDWIIMQKKICILQPNILGTGPDMIETVGTSWKQFFAVLLMDHLFFYRAPPTAITVPHASPKDSLPEPNESLASLLNASIAIVKDTKYNKPNCFEVTCRASIVTGARLSPTKSTKDNLYVFMASTPKLRKQWIDAFVRMQTDLPKGATPTPPLVTHSSGSDEKRGGHHHAGAIIAGVSGMGERTHHSVSVSSSTREADGKQHEEEGADGEEDDDSDEEQSQGGAAEAAGGGQEQAKLLAEQTRHLNKLLGELDMIEAATSDIKKNIYTLTHGRYGGTSKESDYDDSW